MVGDSLERDIGGAQNVGIRGVWMNPKGRHSTSEVKPFAEIASLSELTTILKDLQSI
jgi:putative hydrolase of the HAD superfamily